MVLTVKGKAAAIVQDAEAYQRLLDVTARADAEEGIRQGLEDVKKRKTRPAKEFFDEFETVTSPLKNGQRTGSARQEELAAFVRTKKELDI